MQAAPVRPTFTYTDADHTYTLEGRRIIGLTETLHSNGYFSFLDNVKDDVAEWARERGKGAHAATLYHDRGTLDPASVHDDVRGYLEGWKEFLKINPLKMIHSEKPIYSAKWRFGCTPDRIVQEGAKSFGALEIKASDYNSPTYQLQTAGQCLAATEFYGIPVRERFVIRLLKTGKFKIERFKLDRLAHDQSIFLCALRVAQDKIERKVK